MKILTHENKAVIQKISKNVLKPDSCISCITVPIDTQTNTFSIVQVFDNMQFKHLVKKEQISNPKPAAQQG